MRPVRLPVRTEGLALQRLIEKGDLAVQPQIRRRQAGTSTPRLTGEQLQDILLSAANKLLATKEAVITNTKEMTKLLFNTKELEAEHKRRSGHLRRGTEQHREECAHCINQKPIRKNTVI
ncbi:hypothetical protein [Pseudoramibacter faecis]|uniref:hypothetical protein n=1 Tax=Pseudoramibacter faecis TaxID=3108534 RepID=UPI002E79CC11|nr:hypothetical protein [Pseudoramibacter sp. HA2172]